MYRSLNCNALEPKSTSSSVVGSIEPLLKVICVSPPAVTVITSEPLKAILVFESASPAILSSCTAPTFDKAASPKSTAPATVSVPDTSTLPFISISVALSSISSVAFISNTVALGALINCDASLNWIAIVLFSNSPVSATCVSVTSLSAPKPSTAASLSSFRSLLISTAVDALMSTVGAVISSSVSASISS